MPMTLVLLMALNISVALGLGFVLGRIYQIRRYELERRVELPPTAYIRSFLPVCRPQHLEFLALRSLRANPHLQQHSHIPGAPKEIASCIAIT
jgi:hypothetical protein